MTIEQCIAQSLKRNRTRSENIKLNGNAVTKLFSIIIPEIIEQVTCEELFERM